jgi:hypothetical protein
MMIYKSAGKSLVAGRARRDGKERVVEEKRW